MSAKLKLTMWIAGMSLILSLILLAFIVWVNNADLVDDAVERLVENVLHNEKQIEQEGPIPEWDKLDFYSKGVYCAFYDDQGNLMRGMTVDELGPEDIGFREYGLQTVELDGDVFHLYDAYSKSGGSGVWIRGIVPDADRSGSMHIMTVTAYTVLPFLLILSIGGGWIIAKTVFKPIEQLTATANSIKEGKDLSRRIHLEKGASEITLLSDTFDSMFDRLEHSFQNEKQFTSDASHELRTPLTIINAACERAYRKKENPEALLTSIQIIDTQSDHMRRIVSQLLDLTRLQQGKERYAFRIGDLSIFVTEVCEEYTPDQDKGITLSTEITPGIPVSFNEQLMASVINNLLQNAYRYGNPGGHILVRLQKDKDYAFLSVSDDGIGIRPEHLSMIWQRFWREDPSHPSGSGTGLGLSIVKEVVDFHGGAMEVISEKGKGSCFTMKLKLETNASEAGEKPVKGH